MEGDKITANRQLAARANCTVKELCMWMAMPNSGGMEAFEKIGAMCSSASKKERTSWLGGLPLNLPIHQWWRVQHRDMRSRTCGGREAVETALA